MIRQQILPGILWSERESTPCGYSAKFEARPVDVKKVVDYFFLYVIKLLLTSRRFLWLQMLRFFPFRIGHCLGARGAAIDNSSVLRECAKATRSNARNQKHYELSGKSNSHGHLS